MDPCQFSETQFSFCFTFEYIKRFFPFVPLPIFPNTVQEGRPGGGYDVRINGNIYLQFKIPMGFYDSANNWNRKYWRVFNGEYYKMKLETERRQFSLLKALQSPLNEVWYVAPEFHTNAVLERHYVANSIVDHSAMFPIESFPPAGAGKHYLVYHPAHNHGTLFSEPIKVLKKKIPNPVELFPRNKQRVTVYEQAKNIANLLIEYGQDKNITEPFSFGAPRKLVKEVYTALLVNYNTHWYPITRV